MFHYRLGTVSKFSDHFCLNVPFRYPLLPHPKVARAVYLLLGRSSIMPKLKEHCFLLELHAFLVHVEWEGILIFLLSSTRTPHVPESS